MTDKEMSDKEMNNVLNALIDRGLITKLKNSNLMAITEKGRKEFAASGLQCLDNKKQYKDSAEMKTAMVLLTILSTGKMEEKLLIDTGYVFEAILDKAIPEFQEALDGIDFSQGDSCQPEKPVS